MERYFEEELKELKEKILYMGKVVESMIDITVIYLLKREGDLRKTIYQKEDEINRLHIEIDEIGLRLIALRQPIAIDLRFIIAGIKINSDLERIGDQTVNIFENTCELQKSFSLVSIPGLEKMADITRDMLTKSLEAFVNRDPDLAKRVILRDDEVDDLKSQTFDYLEKMMVENKENISSSIDFILISRNLERIADHATNIAEDVIFMVLGKDIRHNIEEIK